MLDQTGWHTQASENAGCVGLQVAHDALVQIWVMTGPWCGCQLRSTHVLVNSSNTNNNKWARRTRLQRRCNSDFGGFGDGFSGDIDDGEGRPVRIVGLRLMSGLVVVRQLEALLSVSGGARKFRQDIFLALFYRYFSARVDFYWSGT